VPSRVIGHFVSPAAPENPDPGATQGADRVGVILAPGPGRPVDLPRPRVPVASRVGKGRHRDPQSLVAGPPEGGDAELPRLQGDRAHAGVGGHRRLGRVAPAGIAELGDQGGGADRRLAVAKQRPENLRVGVGGKTIADLGIQGGDLLDDRAEGRDQTEPDRPPRPLLRGSRGALRRRLHPRHQLGGLGAPAIGVAPQEAGHAPAAEPLGVIGARVALDEGERDRRVDVCEHQRPGPEGLELSPQLVCQLHPHPDQVLARAGQRPERLGLIAIWDQRPEAVGIGAGQLGQDVGVKAVGLAARDREAGACGLHLVGVDRQDFEAGAEEALDQDPVGALDRHPSDARSLEPRGKSEDPTLVVRRGEALDHSPLVADADLMGLARPVDSRGWCHASSLVDSGRSRAGREEPLRVLIGWRSQTPRPVGASGASHRREVLASRGPSMRQAPKALSRRRSALCVQPGFSTASLHSASISRSQENKGEVLL